MNASPVPGENRGDLVEFPADSRRKDGAAGGAELTREQRRTIRLVETLPPGITIGFRTDGREKPWYVRFGAKRQTASFVTERDRNNKAEELASTAVAEGRTVLDFDPVEWRKLLRFKERTGVSIEEAEDIVLRVKGNLRLNLTVEEAAQRYMDLRIGEGLPKLSAIHPRLHLKRFCECLTEETRAPFGSLTLFAIRPEHIRHWLAELKKQGFGPVTLRHHRKNLNVFFERAKLEKWCVENPCEAVPPPKVADTPGEVLTPQEIFRLLKANRDHPVVGRLVFELFGGLRCSSVERLIATDVRTESRGILLRGSSMDEETEKWKQGHKTGKQKYREGHPPVLWEWVEHAGAAAFEEITEKNYDERKRAAFIRGGWENVPHNRLRHCFASYLLAYGMDPWRVARLMQHTSWKMLERYEGVAMKKDAALVLSMSPTAVLMSWEEFLQRWPDHYEPLPASVLASNTHHR